MADHDGSCLVQDESCEGPQLKASLRQIALGKARDLSWEGEPEYKRYLEAVPKARRTASQPRTPDPRARVAGWEFLRDVFEWQRGLDAPFGDLWSVGGFDGDANNPLLDLEQPKLDGTFEPQVIDQRASVGSSRSTAASDAETPDSLPVPPPLPVDTIDRFFLLPTPEHTWQSDVEVAASVPLASSQVAASDSYDTPLWPPTLPCSVAASDSYDALLWPPSPEDVPLGLFRVSLGHYSNAQRPSHEWELLNEALQKCEEMSGCGADSSSPLCAADGSRRSSSSSSSWAPLMEAVDALLKKCEPDSREECEVMNSIVRWAGGGCGTLLRILRHLTASPCLLEETAGRTYGHNNGFLKIVLFQTAGGHALRIHARAPCESGFREDLCHNHRAPFASLMVAGALHFDILQLLPLCPRGGAAAPPPAPGSSGGLAEAEEPAVSGSAQLISAHEYTDARANGQDGTSLKYEGRCTVCVTEECVRVGAGASYTLDCNTLHRLVVPPGDREGSLTVVLRRSKARDFTTMLTAKERGTAKVEKQQGMEPETLERRIAEVCEFFCLPRDDAGTAAIGISRGGGVVGKAAARAAASAG